MWKFKHLLFPKITVPLIIGTGLLFIPLIRDFHIESALLASLVGCFWGGMRACKTVSLRNDLFSALQVGGYLFLTGLPLLINAVFTGCFSIDGLAFWLLFPLPGVFFGYAVGRLLRSRNLKYRRLTTAGILLLVALGIFIYELLTYPQVYFFNHVWGAWPGPIYDETVKIDGSIVFFRSLTVLWALLLWNIPTLKEDHLSKWVVGFSVAAIAISYTQLAEFGIISPRSHIQKVLEGHKATDHFDLYYDKQFYSNYEISLLAAEHEFYFRQISDHLQLTTRDTADKIESYLYAHPWQKKVLVGAKFTSYVPVWLKQDQLHIARQQIESSLEHELVHVLAKEFGNRWFNASWSIGLIEGLAVAAGGGASSTTTVDQVVVAEKPYPSARELEKAFSFWGFYGGRSGVNYVTSGSFVKFLIDNYPIKSLKKAYRSGSLNSSYNRDWETLAAAWHRHLDSVQVDSVDKKTAGRIFAILSLFEKKCPHVISDFAAAWDAYEFNLANRDTTRALIYLDRALVEADRVPSLKSEWCYRHLLNGHHQKVQQSASLTDTTVNLQLLYADAFALTGDLEKAQRHLDRAQKWYAEKPDSLLKPAVLTRMDSRQWEIYRGMTYRKLLPDSTTFSEANYRTKIRSLDQAIQRREWAKVKSYARQLLDYSLQQKYFDDYQKLIHHLAYLGNGTLAKRIIHEVSALPLRERYRERLKGEQEWLAFLKFFHRNGI